MRSSGTITQKLSGFGDGCREVFGHEEGRARQQRHAPVLQVNHQHQAQHQRERHQQESPGRLVAIIRNDDVAIASVWRRCVTNPWEMW